MDENIVSLISELSRELVKSSDFYQDGKVFDSETRIICRKAFDSIRCFNPRPVKAIEWDPEVDILDYSHVLAEKGESKSSEILRESVQELMSENYSHLRDVLQFLWQLKQPFKSENVGEVEKPHPFSFSGDDYFFKGNQPFAILPKEIITNENSTSSVKVLSEPKGILHLFIDKESTPKVNSAVKQLSLDYFVSPTSPIKPIPVRPAAQACKPEPLRVPSTKEVDKVDVEWHFLQEALKNGEDIIQNEEQVAFIDGFQEELEDTLKTHLRRKRKKVKKELESPKGLLLDIFEQNERVIQTVASDSSMNYVNLVKQSEFVESIKFLLVGIDSSLFTYRNDEDTFQMKNSICLGTVLPPCLVEFSQDFIETGNNYVKLKERCEEVLESDVVIFGTVYKALWKNILEHLQILCDRVAAISNDDSLYELKTQAHDLNLVMSTLHKLFYKNTKLPVGGSLLTYLFDACLLFRQGCVKDVLLSLLLDCTSVYLKKVLQVWAFDGKLSSASALDFFVIMNTMSSQDRSYYTSIVCNPELVPSFMKVLTDRILSCGKAVHLLKMINGENRFARYLEEKQYPQMHLAFSEDELRTLVIDFKKYEDYCNKISGETVTFVTLLDNEQKQVEERSIKIREMQLEALAKRRGEHVTQLEMKRKMKEEQNEMLKEQIAIQAKLKEERKRLEEETERKVLKEQDEILKKEMDILEAGKKATREYYEELLKSAEKMKKKADWRERRLLNRATTLEDVLNDNNVLDNEGNIIRTLSEWNGNFVAEGEASSTEKSVEDVNRNLGDSFMRIEDLEVIEKGRENFEIAKREAEMNRNKLMNSEYLGDCYSGGNGNLNQIPKALENDADGKKCGADPVLSDSLKNKMRVMGTDIGKDCLSSKREAPKVNVDVMKNKKEILGNDWAKEDVPEEESSKVLTGTIENKIMIEDMRSNSHEDNLPSNAAVMTEALKNKMKILGMSDAQHEEEENSKVEGPKLLTDAMRNKMKILGTEYNLPADEEFCIRASNMPKKQTDAMKNKMKILGMEYNLHDEEETQSKVAEGPKVLTEAMKNKMKVLGMEFDLQKNEEPHQKKASESKVLTEAMKNKMKVLGSEYDIVVGSGIDQPSQTKVELPLTDRQRNKNKIMGTEIGEKDKDTLRTDLKTLRTESASRVEVEAKTEHDEIEEERQIKSKPLPAFAQPLLLPEYPSPELFPCLKNQLTGQKGGKIYELSADTLELYLRGSIQIAISAQERLANAELLKLFLQEQNFMSHVFSLRCFFLLYDGEFCRSLTKNLFESLAAKTEPQQFFESNSLSTILNEALASTTHSSQLSVQNLSFQIVEMPSKLELETHDMLTPFQLAYKVTWPMNIIITDAALLRYRKAFHTFLSLKRLHWCFNESFLHLSAQSKDKAYNGLLLRNSQHYTKLSIYRHAMQLFVMTLQDHLCANGPYEAWQTFMEELKLVHCLDELYLTHVRFLKDVLKRCFMTKIDKDLLDFTQRLIETGLQFHYTLIKSPWILTDKVYIHPEYNKLRTLFNSFCKTTQVFQKTLKKRASQPDMQCHAALLEIINVKIKI